MNVNGIFDPQNHFWMFMNKVMDVCTVSLLWFLFSIPLITVGAATTALFHFLLKLSADEEGYVWRTFFNSFRRNFLQATVLWMGGLLAGAFLALDLYYCQFLVIPQPLRIFLFAALCSIIIVYLLTMLYVFPLVACFKVGLKKSIVNAFVMSVGNLYVSVTVLVIYGISGVLTYFMPVLFMVWYAAGCFVSSFFFRSVFEKYMEKETEEDDDIQ